MQYILFLLLGSAILTNGVIQSVQTSQENQVPEEHAAPYGECVPASGEVGDKSGFEILIQLLDQVVFIVRSLLDSVRELIEDVLYRQFLYVLLDPIAEIIGVNTCNFTSVSDHIVILAQEVSLILNFRLNLQPFFICPEWRPCKVDDAVAFGKKLAEGPFCVRDQILLVDRIRRNGTWWGGMRESSEESYWKEVRHRCYWAGTRGPNYKGAEFHKASGGGSCGKLPIRRKDSGRVVTLPFTPIQVSTVQPDGGNHIPVKFTKTRHRGKLDDHKVHSEVVDLMISSGEPEVSNEEVPSIEVDAPDITTQNEEAGNTEWTKPGYVGEESPLSSSDMMEKWFTQSWWSGKKQDVDDIDD